MHHRSIVIVAILALSASFHTLIAAGPALPDADTIEKWGSQDLVVVGKLESVQQGPTAKSLPPIYSHTLTVKVERAIRGEANPGEAIKLHHSARQHDRPTFPEGKRIVVGVKKSRGGMSVQQLVVANDDTVLDIESACSMPVGWTVVDGKLLSPWSKFGDAGWVVDANNKTTLPRCDKTGRPAYKLPTGIALAVESVPPVKAIKWTNPDGDGAYKLTVTNTTDEPIVIPALRRVGDRVLWDESIVVRCQGKAYTIPGAVGVGVKTEPLTLDPGASASHVVNVLQFIGPKWPKGGYRIEFTFAIGDKSATKSLYYMSRHHDALRKKAVDSIKRGG